MSHYDDLGEPVSSGSADTIGETLSARGKNYGEFKNHATLSQGLKNAIVQHYYNTHGQSEAVPLSPVVNEAIAMVCHKLARIANGDPNYIDSWRDISGYATLVCEDLSVTDGATDTKTTPITYKDGNWI